MVSCIGQISLLNGAMQPDGIASIEVSPSCRQAARSSRENGHLDRIKRRLETSPTMQRGVDSRQEDSTERKMRSTPNWRGPRGAFLSHVACLKRGELRRSCYCSRSCSRKTAGPGSATTVIRLRTAMRGYITDYKTAKTNPTESIRSPSPAAEVETQARTRRKKRRRRTRSRCWRAHADMRHVLVG